MCCNGFAELGEHDRAGDPVVRGDGDREPGVVVEEGQDLGVGVGAGPAIGSGEPVMGEVGLPGCVGLLGGEPDVGGLGSLLRFGDDQPGLGQVPGDRRPGDCDVVVVVEVPADGVGTGVQSRRGQFLAQLDDEGDGLSGIAFVELLGRRDRGSKTASPSVR